MSRFRSASTISIREWLADNEPAPPPPPSTDRGPTVPQIEQMILLDLRAGPLPVDQLARSVVLRFLVGDAIRNLLTRSKIMPDRDADGTKIYGLLDAETRRYLFG